MKAYTIARYPLSEQARQMLGRAYVQTLGQRLKGYALALLCGVAIGAPAVFAVVCK